MKQILILSDSHGLLEEDAMKHVMAADEIWHGGDWGANMLAFEQLEKTGKVLRAVFGNIDCATLRATLPESTFFVSEGVKVFMTHIGGYPGRYSKGIKELLKSKRPHIFICGHSHILKVIQDKELGILHINPGACGRNGFHVFRTMVRLIISPGKVERADVIQLGTRAGE